MMADLDKIMTALRNAHAAGDTAAAKRLAAMAKAAQGAPKADKNRDPRDGMTPGERAKAAREGTLKPPSDARLARQAEIDAQSEIALRDPGALTAAAAGAAQGSTFGFADEIIGGVGAAGGLVGDLATGNWSGVLDRAGARYAGARDFTRALTENARVARPKTTMAAEIGGAVMSPASAAFIPARGASLAGTVGNAAMAGGAAGALYGFGTGEGGVGQRVQNAATSALGGAVIGGAIPVVGDLAGKGLQKLVSPNAGADDVRLALGKVLDDFGVPITAGQRTGSKQLMYREGQTAGGRRIAGDQAEAFTEAALKTAGINAKRATPEVLDEAATRIGQVFDDVTRGVDVTPDRNSITALSQAVSEYKSLAPTANQAPLVSNIFKDVTKAFRGGNTIPAATVNTWRSSLSKLTTSADAATREAARMALETVDDMLTQSLNAAGRMDDVARLATARGQWRNFLAIQKVAVREGDGLLSPAKLRATVIQQGEAAFARGKRGDLGTLARAGGEVMEALPDSGTAQRWFANIPGGAPGLLGVAGASGAASAGLGTLGTIGVGLAGAALPSVAGAIRMSGPVQRYLGNQVGNALAPAVANIINRLAPAAVQQGGVPVGNALAGR
jgi:hypothetical protein